MPKQEEVAEVTVNGSKFRDWDSVRVEQNAGGEVKGLAIVQLSVTEAIGGKRTYATEQIKPGDKATVTLAGKTVCTGIVTQRQASYDAHNHGVMIVIRSFVSDMADSSAPIKDSQFKDYPLKAIAEKVCKPFNIEVQVENPSKSFDRKFKEAQVIPGESAYAFIERFARQRGMQVHDNENGNLVLASGTTGTGGDLVEGKNILSGNCVISDASSFDNLGVVGQQRGDDKIDDETARKPAGKVQGDANRYRPRIVIAENAQSAADMATRAETERDTLLGKQINARVVVQGWLQDSGDLWKIRQIVTVNSPMLLLNGIQLGVQTLVFAQDNAGGTTTMLELVKPEAMGAIGTGATGGLPGGGSGNSGEVEV